MINCHYILVMGDNNSFKHNFYVVSSHFNHLVCTPISSDFVLILISIVMLLFEFFTYINTPKADSI